MLKLYNTLTRKIGDFVPLRPPQVSFYSCGPTVYDYAHIGHARTFIFADILERVLQSNGFKVKRVMNITDVGHLTSDQDSGEDKMEKGAKREKKTVFEIARFFTADFFQMLQLLNIKKPEYLPKATDCIKEMIGMIRQLEKKGFTYIISDGMYFDSAKLPEYGKLMGLNFLELNMKLKAGERIGMVSGKKHLTDFALWKFTPPGVIRQMEWESPWGKGFPGWHIECSAMSMEYLGKTIDIHTGGVDHIPVHHTNEIAQSESASGKPFVRYWLHAAHLLVEGQKMSKSLNNFYRLQDLKQKGFDPLALRYLFLTASYRVQMNFTWKSLTASQKAYRSLKEEVGKIKMQFSQKETKESSEQSSDIGQVIRDKFLQAINDDLNMAKALAILWETIKSSLPAKEKYQLILYFDQVFGLRLGESKSLQTEEKIPETINQLVKEREGYRKLGKYEEADKVREEIEKQGFRVEDTSAGVIVRKTRNKSKEIR